MELKKYPRTPHLEGSRLQPGDEDLSQIPFSAIRGRHLAVEEKCDGANSAISFSPEGQMLLQSRGHYLTGGWRERHYNLMKQWANIHADTFFDLLGCRYILYGEWMYAKHTVFYDALPHYFLEFDIFDREEGLFLDTPRRQKLLAGSPVISAPVLAQGVFQKKEDLLALLGQSKFITNDHMAALERTCRQHGIDPKLPMEQTDPSTTMEGLYIKIEEEGRVVERLKFVRPSFYQAVELSGNHWQDRPIVPNRLAGDWNLLL